MYRLFDGYHLEQKNAELQSDSNQNQNLAAENQELKKQVQACTEKSAELEKKNVDLQSAIDQNQHLMAENQKLKETIDSCVAEIDSMKSRLVEIRAMTKVQDTAEAQSSEIEPGSAP